MFRLPAPCENYEYACGVLFMMILPPYFLVYDQTLLAVPLVMLWSSPAWRWGVALFATATVRWPTSRSRSASASPDSWPWRQCSACNLTSWKIDLGFS